MAKALFVEADRSSIVQRVKNLSAQAQRRWGKMDVRQMLQHVTDPLKTALGEFPVVVRGNPLMRTGLMKHLVIYVLPWPKGRAPTAPEYDQVLRQNPGPEFQAGVAELLRTIDRFAAIPLDHKFGHHGAFETLTREQWGALMYRHLGHHLTQFGA